MTCLVDGNAIADDEGPRHVSWMRHRVRDRRPSYLCMRVARARSPAVPSATPC